LRVECFERPRKVKAKYTGENLAPDEVFKEIEHDFESKRDRWAGYDPNTYSEVIQEFESYEQERKLQQ
jgi:pre-mRNA-processing factor SLU7